MDVSKKSKRLIIWNGGSTWHAACINFAVAWFKVVSSFASSRYCARTMKSFLRWHTCWRALRWAYWKECWSIVPTSYGLALSSRYIKDPLPFVSNPLIMQSSASNKICYISSRVRMVSTRCRFCARWCISWAGDELSMACVCASLKCSRDSSASLFAWYKCTVK